MGPRREILAFCVFLAICIAAFFHETLFGGKVLSPADVLLVSASFRGESPARLPAGQPALDGSGASVPALAGIQPPDDPQRSPAALEWSCRLRCASSRERAKCGLRPVPSAGLSGADAGGLRLDRCGPAVDGRVGDVPAGTGVGPGAVWTVVRRVGLPVLGLSYRLALVPRHVSRHLAAVARPGDGPRDRGARARKRLAGWPWSSLS